MKKMGDMMKTLVLLFLLFGISFFSFDSEIEAQQNYPLRSPSSDQGWRCFVPAGVTDQGQIRYHIVFWPNNKYEGSSLRSGVMQFSVRDTEGFFSQPRIVALYFGVPCIFVDPYHYYLSSLLSN